MDMMEIFTLVTGVIYIILEIRQKNLMWLVGVLTSVAAMWVFFRQGLYAPLPESDKGCHKVVGVQGE